MLLHNAPFLQSIRVSGSHLAQYRARGLRSPQTSGVRASLEVQESATMSSSKEMLQKVCLLSEAVPHYTGADAGSC